MPRRDRRNREGGFTLVELLVAITLLGLLSLVLVGGLRFGARAWEKVETDSRELQDLMIARDFLSARLERGLPLAPSGDGSGEQPVFQGSERSLRFLTDMPGRLGARGLQRVALDLRRHEDGADLLLRWGPTTPGGEAAGSRALLRDIASMRFAYYDAGSDDREGGWLDRWEDSDRLPALVRIAVSFPEGDGRAWPPLLVAPRLALVE